MTIEDEAPATVPDIAAALQRIDARLEQMNEVILSLSGAVVQLNENVQQHLDSHSRDAERHLKSVDNVQHS